MPDPGSDQPVVTVTDKARRHVAELRAAEEGAETLALWLEVQGRTATDFAYDLYFQPVEEAGPGDVVEHHDDLSVVVPAASVDLLRGATLDMSRDLLHPGLTLDNPNRPAPPPRPASPQIAVPEAGELTGEVADRVRTVLEEHINPGIAAHGGRAELVAVEENSVYLRLLGGCVGCGMAAVTLSQGIEVAIRQAVPEVERIVDVTDHASGTNPYYEAAKK